VSPGPSWLAHVLGASLLIATGCRRTEPTGEHEPPSRERLQSKILEVYRLQGEVNLRALNTAIANFQQVQGRNPDSLQELVEQTLIEEIPAAPPGQAYAYDAEAGNVTLVSDGSSAGPAVPQLTDLSPAQLLQHSLDVKAKADLKMIRTAIDVFLVEEGRYPSTLEDLVQRRLLDSIPPPPPGMAYRYDPNSGKVNLTAE
jgi:hypothetical protein